MCVILNQCLAGRQVCNISSEGEEREKEKEQRKGDQLI